jgi:hypothetical protein
MEFELVLFIVFSSKPQRLDPQKYLNDPINRELGERLN